LILQKCLVAKKNNEPGATPKPFLEGSIFLARMQAADTIKETMTAKA